MNNLTKKEKLVKAGVVAKKAHIAISKLIKPGVTTMTIENKVADIIRTEGMKPAFLGYKKYPAVTCISINDEIVHGIPSSIVLKEGDIVTVDLGIDNQGAIIDTARTHPVGVISEQASNLLIATEYALKKGIEQARVGKKTGDIGAVVEKIINDAGFYIVRDLTGHGVGVTLQEPPSIPNFGTPNTGTLLIEGMVLAIEPITSIKESKIAVKSDNWTIVALNNCLTAHFEDTVLITKDGPIVLT